VGVGLGSTGGHADLNGFSPYLRFHQIAPGVVDGPDAIRKAVRTNIKYGADWIKIMASAGVLSEEESVGAPQYSVEEMKAAVDEAALSGTKSPRTPMAPKRSRWPCARASLPSNMAA
jgi:imidazolonepropionase-like amidohydrolase